MTVSTLPANHRLDNLSRSIGWPDQQQKRSRDVIAVSDKAANRVRLRSTDMNYRLRRTFSRTNERERGRERNAFASLNRPIALRARQR